MYSNTQFDISPVNNDVSVVENILPEGHWNSNNTWDPNLFPESVQSYETSQRFPQAQQTCLNLHVQQLPEQCKAVHNDFIQHVPVPSTITYQGRNISQIYPTNLPGNTTALNLFQNQFHQVLPCSNTTHMSRCYEQSSPKFYGVQTNHVHAKPGLKAISKRKRKRTMFTTEQVAVLEKFYLSKPYVNREERQVLVEQLQINDKIIKVWFQNRRLKEKREAEEAKQEMYAPDTQVIDLNSKFDELSYVESQINQTDQFGYVTLDNRAINGLVSVIDTLLSPETQVSLSEESCDTVVPNKQEDSERTGSTSSVYEPISPASSECTSIEEQTTSYEPFEPQESLQRIFDIQEFLIFNKSTVK